MADTSSTNMTAGSYVNTCLRECEKKIDCCCINEKIMIAAGAVFICIGAAGTVVGDFSTSASSSLGFALTNIVSGVGLIYIARALKN